MVVFGCCHKSPSAYRVVTQEMSRLAGLSDMVLNFHGSECACEGVRTCGAVMLFGTVVVSNACKGHCFDLHPIRMGRWKMTKAIFGVERMRRSLPVRPGTRPRSSHIIELVGDGVTLFKVPGSYILHSLSRFNRRT
jgi:hypothetical protein